MSKATLGRDVALELVKAMALPVEGCMAVDIDLRTDAIATVAVTYHLLPETLAAAAKALQEQGE